MKNFFYWLLTVLIGTIGLGFAAGEAAVYAYSPDIAEALITGDINQKIIAIQTLSTTGTANDHEALRALDQGALYVTGGNRLVIMTDTEARDAMSLEPIVPTPSDIEKVTINNRVRNALSMALASFDLSAPDAVVRLEAAKQLQEGAPDAFLPLIVQAIAQEKDSKIKKTLLLAQGGIEIKSSDAARRLEAVRILAQSDKDGTRALLQSLLEKDPSGNQLETDPTVRKEVSRSIAAIDRRLMLAEYAGYIFSGISLGSVLLLTALGLAIVYGLMGVINMAHGEFLMIGAYATYEVQVLFQQFWPQAFDYYLLFSVPAAFLSAALVGVLLELSVIRYLYGRPLETLLATWGVSLIVIQAVRMIFGAQNVEVANPFWMSGGFSLIGSLILPYNRIVIIFFSLAVVTMVWWVLSRTRLGLFVRAVTQNRTMAGCVGVPIERTNMWSFGLGSGIAGLGGCALSQIGNVGPDLGQSYIVDSFMVVVLGGVGQVTGTVAAALGLGIVNKFLESFMGAVLAKILVLVVIILIIQKRPQGLFALKGRMADN